MCLPQTIHMPISNTTYTFSLSMLYAGFKRVENWWNFRNVIGPFYRLYYIENGRGRVYINNVVYDLLPGQLFLIPKFAFHSYECDDFMDHYYICFFDDLNGVPGVLNPLQLNLQPEAAPMDFSLIKRYLELNPYKSLQVVDPQSYDNTKSLYENRTEKNLSQLSHTIESHGILLQLFSRFITEASMSQLHGSNSYIKLDEVIQYIHKNLDKRITVIELSERMCLTPDHFSKVFKKIIGVPPCEYIQMKRIERAQAMLISSKLNIMQIAECVGIYNPAQFTRLFSKLTQCSPREYRAKQLNDITYLRKKDSASHASGSES